MTKAELILAVRRAIRDVPDAGDVSTDAAIQRQASAAFSDDDLWQRLTHAARSVAAAVRASSLPGLQRVVTPDSLPTDGSVLRFLGSRVTVASAVATRRSFRGHRSAESSGRQATPEFPSYVCEDGELQVYPQTDGVPPQGTRVAYVAVPETALDLPPAVQHAAVLRAAGVALASYKMIPEATRCLSASARAMSEGALPVLSGGVGTDARTPAT